MRMAKSSGAWMTAPIPRPDARMRLFCFPYAGGGALAYQAWPRLLPDEIEVVAVQLPGREARFREPPMTDLSTLVEALVAAMYPYETLRPFAFFGHSLGALIAFVLAQAL